MSKQAIHPNAIYIAFLLILSIAYGCIAIDNQQSKSLAIDEQILSQWTQHCESLKTKWSKEPLLKVKSQSIPNHGSNHAYWSLRTRESIVPLPATDYQSVNVKHDVDKNHSSVFMKGAGQTVIIIQSGQDAFVPLSSWDASVISPNYEPEIVAEWSKRNLPKAPTTFEALYFLSLDSQPTDLNCTQESAKRDMAISNALHAKSILPVNSLEAAYKFSVDSQSWMTLSKVYSLYEWQVALFDGTQPSQIITMRVSPKDKDIGLLLNQPNTSTAPNPPSWLQNLQNALVQSSKKENWEKLAESLEAAGIDNSSVKKIVESLDES